MKMATPSNLLKVRCDGREMICTKPEEIFFTDFYVVGNPRKALRKQIALAYVMHQKGGDKWWVSDEAFEPIKRMKARNEIIAFLQPFVDKDAEKYAAAVAKAEAMK